MSEGDNSFSTHIINAAAVCAKRNAPYFTRFLTEEEQAVLKNEKLPDGVFSRLYGGEKNTEYCRAVLGVFPLRFYDFDAEQLDGIYPIKALTFTFRESDTITHRNVLGTLISLGIERDRIGDIYVGEGVVIVYLYDTVSDYVAQSITKIGGVGVTVIQGAAAELPKREFKDIKLSVSSLRLDNIISHAIGTSRSAAQENYVKAQRVSLNSVLCTDCSKQLAVGDKISVRGVGKFIFHAIDGEGRKGNIHITVKKYI